MATVMVLESDPTEAMLQDLKLASARVVVWTVIARPGSSVVIDIVLKGDDGRIHNVGASTTRSRFGLWKVHWPALLTPPGYWSAAVEQMLDEIMK